MSEVNSTFFSKLKSVCRDVEQGISQLQNEVETKTSSRSNGNAVIKLTNIKQEIQDMKVDVRQKCQTLDAGGVTCAELISCCRSLIDIQSHKLHNIEIFMKQYGYNDFKPKEEVKEELPEECDDTKENEQPITPPPQEDNKHKKVKTPKPEDFGFSSYTLRALKRGFNTIQQDITRPVPHSEARIPSIFNDDNFVSLTPSVFGRHVPFHTPGKYQDASPTYADFFTPLDKKVISTDQKYASDFPKFNLGEDNPSPTPPVFQTPGMNHLGKKENFEKSAPVSAFTSIQKAPMNSPQVPVFQSESVKKMMDKSSVAMEKESSVKTSRAKLYDYMPQTPEFTFNIKKLREMSGFTEEPQFIKPDPLTREPVPPTLQYKGLGDADMTMPKDFQPLAERLGHDITSNITPPMPEMLSDRHSKFSSTSNQQIRDLSKTPPTPKFLSKYVNDLVQKKYN